MTSSWFGVFPALTTPFREDLSIDHGALSAHADRLVSAGVNGLVVLGSLGENGSLSVDEKLAIVKTVVGRSSLPVLAGVAEATPKEAERRILEAAECGAHGIMLLPPMRYRGDRREILAYLTAVAGSSPLPVMIYNNPVTYGMDVTPEMFAELASIPEIVALKESSNDPRRIPDIIHLTGNRYQIFIGVDDLALEGFLLGARGWVAGLVCAFPEESVALYGLARAGRWEEARRLYRWFMPLLHLDTSPKFVHYIKLAQELTAMGSAGVRPPRLPLEGAERARIEAVLQQAIAQRSELDDVIRSGLGCASVIQDDLKAP